MLPKSQSSSPPTMPKSSFERRWKAFLRRACRDIEVIVIDDGSTDSTPSNLAYVFRSPSDRVLRQEKQRRQRSTKRRSCRRPRALCLLSRCRRHSAARCARSNGHHARSRCRNASLALRIISGLLRMARQLSTRSDLRWKLFPAGDTLRHLIAKNFIVCGAICIRTDAARAVHGFNPALKLGEDWEFWCRLAVLGDFAAMPNDIALIYRQRFRQCQLSDCENRRCSRISKPSMRFIPIPSIQQKFLPRRIETPAAPGGNRRVLGRSAQ